MPKETTSTDTVRADTDCTAKDRCGSSPCRAYGSAPRGIPKTLFRSSRCETGALEKALRALKPCNYPIKR
jgi:hypothetical protein